MREVVTTLRLHVELVRKLHEAWVTMGSKGDMVLSSEQLIPDDDKRYGLFFRRSLRFGSTRAARPLRAWLAAGDVQRGGLGRAFTP